MLHDPSHYMPMPVAEEVRLTQAAQHVGMFECADLPGCLGRHALGVRRGARPSLAVSLEAGDYGCCEPLDSKWLRIRRAELRYASPV